MIALEIISLLGVKMAIIPVLLVHAILALVAAMFLAFGGTDLLNDGFCETFWWNGARTLVSSAILGFLVFSAGYLMYNNNSIVIVVTYYAAICAIFWGLKRYIL